MSLLRFVGRLHFGLGNFSFDSSCCLGLFDLLFLSSPLSGLLDVELAVPMDIESVGTALMEEELQKVLLQLLLSDGLEQLNLNLLPVKLVLVSRHLAGPNTIESFSQVLILL